MATGVTALAGCTHGPDIALSSRTTQTVSPGAYSLALAEGAKPGEAEALVKTRLASLGFAEGSGLKVTPLWTVRPATVGAYLPPADTASGAPQTWLQTSTPRKRFQRKPRFTYTLAIVFTDASSGKERYRVQASLVDKEGRASQALPLLVNAALAQVPLPAIPGKRA